MNNMAFSHEETIICPNCLTEQTATVEHTQPFDTKVHECTYCGYVITESDLEEKKAGVE